MLLRVLMSLILLVSLDECARRCMHLQVAHGQLVGDLLEVGTHILYALIALVQFAAELLSRLVSPVGFLNVEQALTAFITYTVHVLLEVEKGNAILQQVQCLGLAQA